MGSECALWTSNHGGNSQPELVLLAAATHGVVNPGQKRTRHHDFAHLSLCCFITRPVLLLLLFIIRNTNWVTFHAKINFAKTDFERTQRQTDLHSIIKSHLRADNGQRRRIYREPPILAERLTLLASPPLFSRGFHSAAASSLSRLKQLAVRQQTTLLQEILVEAHAKHIPSVLSS